MANRLIIRLQPEEEIALTADEQDARAWTAWSCGRWR